MNGKIYQNKNLYSHTHSFLSATNHLGKIKGLGYIRSLHILLCVNKTKFDCFKKKIILTASKNIKI